MMRIWEEFPGENEIHAPEAADLINANVELFGKGNKLRLGIPHMCSSLYVKATGENTIEIGEGCVFLGQVFHLLAPGALSIGPRCGFNGTSVIHIHERARITIGADCLFGPNVVISVSHVHKIIDVGTGDRINPAGDITIEDHVWLSSNVTVWGGAHISKDSVVGLGSYVSKRFPANCIIAGAPAKVIRTGTTWEF